MLYFLKISERALEEGFQEEMTREFWVGGCWFRDTVRHCKEEFCVLTEKRVRGPIICATGRFRNRKNPLYNDFVGRKMHLCIKRVPCCLSKGDPVWISWIAEKEKENRGNSPGRNLRRTCCRLGSSALCRCCHCSRFRPRNRRFRRTREKEATSRVAYLRSQKHGEDRQGSVQQTWRQTGERWQHWVITCSIQSRREWSRSDWWQTETRDKSLAEERMTKEPAVDPKKKGGRRRNPSDALPVETIGHGNQTGMFACNYVLCTVARASAKHTWLRGGSD